MMFGVEYTEGIGGQSKGEPSTRPKQILNMLLSMMLNIHDATICLITAPFLSHLVFPITIIANTTFQLE